MNGFEVFRAFVPELAEVLDDPESSEVEVNSSRTVFVERGGTRTLVPMELDERRLMTACVVMASRLDGTELCEEHPIVDTTLADGSRVAISIPPVSVDGVTLTIRKHQRRYYSLETLVALGMLTGFEAAGLRAAVEGRENILISGGTSTGKTTLADALAHSIPGDERVIVIEDTTEIELPHPNQRRFKAVAGKVSIDDVLRATLRHSPDRIILGEVRGKEASQLLELLNTGHGGSISTIHASSAALALRRLSTCVMKADTGVPYAAIRSEIADSINVVVHLKRRDGKRELAEILRVKGYNDRTDEYLFAKLEDVETIQ
jgi:pilus assembly protein CpaF